MNMFIIDNEIYVRLGSFLSIFAFMAVWEIFAPRRRLTKARGTRWFNNLTLTILNSILVRVIFPLAAVGAAFVSREQSLGLFNNIAMPEWAEGIVAIIMLDLTVYAQHVFFHRISLFWRLHRMHHTDLDIDVTTGARFHPIEIILSMVIKMAVVIALGAPAWSVVIFEVLLNATAMFNHSNIYMNGKLDRILRMFIVTPDMHRVHHSVIIKETDSNFGFNLPWWDRLFKTYQDQPALGHEGMSIGLANYRDVKWLKLPWMLAVPFARMYR
jgi:sterol desaturase/sphingolipid hydroxylase (fatty acid hydroxylase superfamily)